jgi:diaminohydroxyphosphoribosylaminopyrimidine deaminase/5-amino-6-(5-phosphoribosylamino)uracil reductase
MVGTNTTLFDNPALNAREWEGRNPIRITIDKNLRLDSTLKLFDGSIPTIVFTEKEKASSENLEHIQIPFDENLMYTILKSLYQKGIQSVIVEGGEQLLNTLINQGIWDEAIVFTSNKTISQGVPSPLISGKLLQQEVIDNVQLSYYLYS